MFVTAPRSVLQFLGLETVVANMIEGAAGALGGGAGLGRDAAGVAGVAAVAAAGADGVGVAANAAVASGFNMGDFLHNMRKFGGFFSYMTSRWSIACFAVVSPTLLYPNRALFLRGHIELGRYIYLGQLTDERIALH